jgi:hypothetical protein
MADKETQIPAKVALENKGNTFPLNRSDDYLLSQEEMRSQD